MICEADELAEDDYDALTRDPFVEEGLSSSSDSEDNSFKVAQNGQQQHLKSAKRFWEQLKGALFKYKGKRARHHSEF
jgi:hypothetical protein